MRPDLQKSGWLTREAHPGNSKRAGAAVEARGGGAIVKNQTHNVDHLIPFFCSSVVLILHNGRKIKKVQFKKKGVCRLLTAGCNQVSKTLMTAACKRVLQVLLHCGGICSPSDALSSHCYHLLFAFLTCFLFTSHLPERLAPGRFDYFGTFLMGFRRTRLDDLCSELLRLI